MIKEEYVIQKFEGDTWIDLEPVRLSAKLAQDDYDTACKIHSKNLVRLVCRTTSTEVQVVLNAGGKKHGVSA